MPSLTPPSPTYAHPPSSKWRRGWGLGLWSVPESRPFLLTPYSAPVWGLSGGWGREILLQRCLLPRGQCLEPLLLPSSSPPIHSCDSSMVLINLTDFSFTLDPTWFPKGFCIVLFYYFIFILFLISALTYCLNQTSMKTNGSVTVFWTGLWINWAYNPYSLNMISCL